jgi:hypothetical protein
MVVTDSPPQLLLILLLLYRHFLARFRHLL